MYNKNVSTSDMEITNNAYRYWPKLATGVYYKHVFHTYK
jgi:hypothetical protein